MSRSSDGVLREALRQMLKPAELKQAERWSEHQWWEAFSFLFLADPGARHALLAAQDDLLWFVTAASALGPAAPPVTLRRNAGRGELPPELRPGGGGFAGVDWGASVALNLVAQAQYELTVVQCGQDALATVAQGHASRGPAAPPHRPAGAPAVATRRRVYASPMSSEVNLEDAKAGRPHLPCYPDVCFAVDNYEEAFQDTILSRPGDCFCVMLHVNAAAAAANPPLNDPPASQPANPGPVDPAMARPPTAPHASNPMHHERRAALFSAYVTREQVAEYLAAHAPSARPPSLLHRLLGAGRDVARPRGGGGGGGRRDRVVMRGPGGVGRAEAVAAAVPAAGAAGGAPGGGADAAGGAAALQLSLLWMSLPAQALAQAVLRFACGEA